MDDLPVSTALPLPKYHRVYLVLREQLQEGRFAAGVPGELALMQQFGVARVTVRRALEQLAQEGLIAREPGRGTRALAAGEAPAADAAAAAPRTQLTGLLENLVSMGLRTSVNLLDACTVGASDGVARALRLAPGAAVQKVVRVRRSGEGPVAHITTYVPVEAAAPFSREQLEREPILLLLEQAGVTLGRAVQTISARLAGADVAPHLDVPVGAALLAVQRLVHDAGDRPVQWLHGLYRPDRYEYEMQSSRVGAIDAKVWVGADGPHLQ